MNPAKLNTGTSRIVWGIVLAALFGVDALGGLVRLAGVIPAMAQYGLTLYELGFIFGVVVPLAVTGIGVVLIVKGVRMRAVHNAALAPAAPARSWSTPAPPRSAMPAPAMPLSALPAPPMPAAAPPPATPGFDAPR